MQQEVEAFFIQNSDFVLRDEHHSGGKILDDLFRVLVTEALHRDDVVWDVCPQLFIIRAHFRILLEDHITDAEPLFTVDDIDVTVEVR